MRRRSRNRRALTSPRKLCMVIRPPSAPPTAPDSERRGDTSPRRGCRGQRLWNRQGDGKADKRVQRPIAVDEMQRRSGPPPHAGYVLLLIGPRPPLGYTPSPSTSDAPLSCPRNLEFSLRHVQVSGIRPWSDYSGMRLWFYFCLLDDLPPLSLGLR